MVRVVLPSLRVNSSPVLPSGKRFSRPEMLKSCTLPAIWFEPGFAPKSVLLWELELESALGTHKCRCQPHFTSTR